MVTVGSIVGGAFRLIARRPGAVALWGLVYLGGIVLISIVFMGALGGAMMAGGFGAGANPEQALASFSGQSILLTLLMYLAYYALAAVLMNAVYRAVLRPEESGGASIRFGRDELRTLGLTLLLGILMMVLAFFGSLILGLIGSALGLAAGGDPVAMDIASTIVLLLFIAGWLVLWVKLSLILPASFHYRRFTLDSGWELSSGHFWPLLGAYLIIIVISILLVLVASLPMIGTIGANFPAMTADPFAADVATQAPATMAAAGGMLLTLLLMMIAGLIVFVLLTGATAVAAREVLIERGAFADPHFEPDSDRDFEAD
ncbi:hypothetical protein [Sphingosinithalassobacter sp. LHW66-3]|uniref:hypothetical protein n=1 Tax=Sphingosinithalassobacter sp. LHW66-3 TaxID=3424718 RepID=UPI003D6BF154